MGLCYDCGFRALTVALALRLPGDYAPLEGPGVTDQQESVAGLSGHSLLTAFPLKCVSLGRWPCVRWGVRESVTDLLRHSLPAKGGIEGCWSGCLCCSSAEAQTDRRASTASLIDLRTALPLDQEAIGPNHRPAPISAIMSQWHFLQDLQRFHSVESAFYLCSAIRKCSCSPMDRMVVYGTSDGGSNPPGSTNEMELWQTWCMRRTENPKNVVQFREAPQTW